MHFSPTSRHPTSYQRMKTSSQFSLLSSFSSAGRLFNTESTPGNLQRLFFLPFLLLQNIKWFTDVWVILFHSFILSNSAMCKCTGNLCLSYFNELMLKSFGQCCFESGYPNACTLSHIHIVKQILKPWPTIIR